MTSSTIYTATASTLTSTRSLYNGTLKLKIIEAEGLKATDYSTRLFQSSSFQLSPYINIDVDDLPVGRTSTKQKSSNPIFNEEFQLNIKSGHVLHFTVFHDSALLPDEFVANCSVTLDDVKALVDAKNAASNTLNSANTPATNPNASDLCIDLEPNGRLHLNVEFEGTFTQGKSP